MIRNYTFEDIEALAKFLEKFNSIDENFVAWLETGYDAVKKQLENQLKGNADNKGLICVEGNEIVGFLDVYCSKEQKVVRLLGPLIKEKYWNDYGQALWEKLYESINMDYKIAKIAFYNKNKNCLDFCMRNGFSLYNAERCLYFSRENYETVESIKDGISVAEYEDKYKACLMELHLKGSYFTFNELLQRLDENNRVLLCLKEGKPVGYTYFEIQNNGKECDICFVGVLENFRGKGYGSILIREVLRKAFNEIGSKEVTIFVRVDNIKAEKLYKSLGFEEKNIVYAYQKEL